MRPISNNARQAYGMLRQKGYSHAHSAALVGNLIQESGWDINTSAVGDNGNAFGSVQWNGPRRKAFLSFAKSRGSDPSDLATQIDYLDQELRTSERSAANAILKTSDLDQATLTASQRFWRPGDPRNENRIRFARAVSAQLGGTPGAQVHNASFAHPNPSFTSTNTRRRQEAEQEENAPGVIEGAGLAIREQWLGSYVLDNITRASKFKPDANFIMNDELWSELTKDLPEHYHDMFISAYSREHAFDLRQRAFDLKEADEQLGIMGTTGTLLRIGAALTDPIGLAASALTAGQATTVRGGRLINMLRGGSSAAAVNVGLDSTLVANNPNMTPTDLLLSGVVGFGVGGALGYFARTELDEAITPHARSIQDEIMGGDGQSMGALRNPEFVDEDALSTAQLRVLQSQDAPESAFGRLRVDMVGTLKQSNHPLIRRLGGVLAEDGVGNADGSVLGRAATEEVTLAMKNTMTQMYRTAEPAFGEWFRGQGHSWWKRRMYRDEFFEEVGRAIRRKPGEYTDDVNINRVADQLRKQQAEILSMARDAGLKGFENVFENPQYLMRRFNQQRIDELIAHTSEAAIRRVIAGAIRINGPGVTQEHVEKIAAGYLRTVQQSRYDAPTLARIFDADQSEYLADMLRESTDLDNDVINSITASLKKDNSDAGKISRAKQRLSVDETHVDKTTGIAFEDLLDNNAERLFTAYSRQVIGASKMAEALRPFAVRGGDAPTLETLLANVRETAGEYGMTRRQLDDEISKLETLAKGVMGQHLGKDNNFGQTLRLLRDYNFIRVMNQVGFAQIAEMGNILGNTGMRAFMQSIPAFRSIYGRAKDGKMSDELLDEIEVIWGLGTDRLRQSFTNRMDDFGTTETARMSRIESAMDHARAVTADISLMAPVNMALQRMSGRAAVQRFMNMAMDGANMSDRRLATLGLSRENAGRVMEQMRKHVSVQEGMLGRSVRRINIDEWDDQEAASLFINGIDRWSRRIIQENDIGMMSQWMTTDLGKSMMQFRTFMVGAWVKQTLHGMHVRDFDTFMAWGTSMFFGGLSYTAQTYINSLGRDDAEEYRDKRLSTEELGKAAFQRAGFASVIPAAADSMITLAGYEPVFAYGRSTGMASGFIGGNPTVDLLDNSIRALTGGAGLLRRERDYSQQDARALTSILPYQNAMGIRNVLNLITQDLPRYSER